MVENLEIRVANEELIKKILQKEMLLKKREGEQTKVTKIVFKKSREYNKFVQTGTFDVITSEEEYKDKDFSSEWTITTFLVNSNRCSININGWDLYRLYQKATQIYEENEMLKTN